ncbi:hypothetical protein ACTNDG_04885 [Clostridium sp. HCP1S3_B4]|uniref:hypothetical protein n=1 Tax=unclassified Clostridium TaxID=2614128 RepID=UPI003F890AFD
MYKCRHAKKKFFSKIGHYRRFFVVILSMLVLCITVAPTYAYFTTSVKDIETGSGLSTLDIENGKANIHANFDDANWTDSDGNIISEKINPDDNTVIKYGPVWLETGDTNITTKVDLLSEYELTNEIDNDWNNGSNPCEPFEVIVGDIDNFGCGVLPDAYDDKTTTTNHSMDIFPDKYDAKGTDRRMVGSRFYYEYKANSVIKANKWYSDDGDDVTNKWKYNLAAFYGYKNSNVNLIYDGYTDRAIRGMDGGGENPTKDCIIDGKNWRYLQSAEPITFKYNKIHNDEEIENVTFQVFTDDIQSSVASKGVTTPFSKKTGNFNVYLIGKDSNGFEFKEEIDDFAKVINDYAQSGPIGNMRTLKLPSKYFNRIKEASGLNNGLKLLIDNEGSKKKEASGLNNGLKLLIDNEEDGSKIKGDSYAIDFAKMTVNAAASSTSKITIYGQIKDDNDNDHHGIANAMVYAEDGSKAQADNDGNYKLTTTAGLIRLKAVADGYVDTVKNFDVFYSDSVNIINKDIEMSSLSGKNKDKYKVTISVKQCDLEGNELSTIGYVESKDVKGNDFKLLKDGTVIQQPIKLSLQPNCKYKLEYELKLNKKDNIDKNNDFTVGFHLNNIKIKGTQENNNGWFSNGTGYDYENGITYKNTNDSNNSGSNSSNASKATDTKIYFEMPQNNDGSLWWQPVTPKISYTNENDTPKVINTSDISDISSEKNGKWYCGITSDKLVNAKIRVDEEEKELEEYIITVKVPQNWKDKNNGSLKVHTWIDGGEVISSGYNNVGEIIGRGICTWNDDNSFNMKIDPKYKDKNIKILIYIDDANKFTSNLKFEKGAKSIDISDYPNYAKNANGELPGAITSGDLYCFNTRRIFICTN